MLGHSGGKRTIVPRRPIRLDLVVYRRSRRRNRGLGRIPGSRTAQCTERCSQKQGFEWPG